MTPKERAAMEQALEALVEADKYYDYDAIIAALREALAEPDIEEMTLTQIAAKHEQAAKKSVERHVENVYERGDKYFAWIGDNYVQIYTAPVQQAEQEPFDMDDHPPHRLCECRKCMEYFTDKAHEEALEHITDGSPCWCNPEMTYKDTINGAEVWVHKEL